MFLYYKPLRSQISASLQMKSKCETIPSENADKKLSTSGDPRMSLIPKYEASKQSARSCLPELALPRRALPDQFARFYECGYVSAGAAF